MLTAGHTVDVVVDYDGGEIYVAPRRVDEVVTTNGGGITIPHHHYDVEFRFGKLYPCGEGAGYAGGIVSAAMDGERCAEAAVGSM